MQVCQILSMSIEGESSLTFEHLEEQVELLEIKNKELKAKGMINVFFYFLLTIWLIINHDDT